jgi:hypothetical protein
MEMDFSKIFLADPLYTNYDIKELDFNGIVKVLFYNEDYSYTPQLKTLDSYCAICNLETTFISKATYEHDMSQIFLDAGYVSNGNGTIEKLCKVLQKEGTFQRKFSCPRPNSDSSHDLVFLFKVMDYSLIKIGQFPSIANLSKKDIEKYRKLKGNIYQEFNRAIGLSSHGVGVGAFVYLRRIVEKHIVLPSIHMLVENGDIEKEAVVHSDFKSKIDMAKNHLPSFLVNNKKIYSILSKGLHELEEKECIEYFPVIRTAIEIILDEEIEKIEKEKKSKLISEQLNNIK